jgi:hypothetical protein
VMGQLSFTTTIVGLGAAHDIWPKIGAAQTT